MFAKLSIRTKLIGVVAFLLLAITGMGLLAVRNMKALNANTVDIAKNWLPSIRVLGDLRAGVITYRNVVREHMLAEEKTLAGVVESDDKIRNTYEAMITSADERALYNEWVKTWQEYRKGVDQVLALSRKEAGQSPHEAHTLNTNTVNKISIAADEILKKDIDLSNTGSEKATREPDNTFDAAFMAVAAILAVAIIVGVAVSYFVVRDISTGIDSIVRPMQALGQGDLTAEVPHQGESTEIGAMADALQVFKQALIAKKAADQATSAAAQ